MGQSSVQNTLFFCKEKQFIYINNCYYANLKSTALVGK